MTALAVKPAHGWPSYAVVWRDEDGSLCNGRIELGPRSLRLCGAAPVGRSAVRQLAYTEVAGIRIERAPEERLCGGPVLLLELHAQPPVRMRTVDGPGTLNELADFIASLLAEVKRGSTRFAVIAPLRDGVRDRTRDLIEQGPPFDPVRLALERHHVFLGDHEVIFLFESGETPSSVERLAADPAIWEAAADWQACLAGPPRVIADAYSWVKTPAA